MQSSDKPVWFTRFQKKSNCRLRLICFPFAGSAASAFRDWGKCLPADVDLLVAQFPGRGARFSDPLISDIQVLVEQMADNFDSYQDLPFVFFGHSIGALVSFQFARVLRDRGMRLPELLFASGKRPPHFPAAQRLHDLPDKPLIEALQNYNGTPETVLQNPELMNIVLPILRADFSLDENYRYVLEPKFCFPILAYGGREDSGVPEDALALWGEHTENHFSYKLFNGGHFYLHRDDSKIQLITDIKRILKSLVSEENQVFA